MGPIPVRPIKEIFMRNYIFWQIKNFQKYKFRRGPVPYTRKFRGGPSWSPPHTAKLNRMYLTPEYKDFNRGSIKEIPQWWDDRHREKQRCWKEQKKCRHQWQKHL